MLNYNKIHITCHQIIERVTLYNTTLLKKTKHFNERVTLYKTTHIFKKFWTYPKII